MKISQVIESRDMCSVCGQTPCNCTHISEGRLHNPDKQDSPVAQAIIRRILLQRTDLLSKYGPGYVGQAVDDVADSVGDVEEIGSSDVSGWVKQVEWNLKNKLNQYDEPINVGDALDEQGVAEGIEIVDQDSDLDQQVYTLNVDGNKVSFTYWDYENNFQSPDIKDIYQQATEQLGRKLSPDQIKDVARAVFKSFEQGVAEGSKDSAPKMSKQERKLAQSALKGAKDMSATLGLVRDKDGVLRMPKNKEQGVAEGLKPVTIESKLEQSLKALEEAVATTQPAATVGQQADAAQQRILDRMGARFGLPPGSSLEQVQAAQQAYLDKNDPAAAAQYKQNMANIDAGQTNASQKPVQLAPKPAPAASAPPAQPAAPAAPAAPAKPNLGADFEAGLAAQRAGGNPTEIMLAQPAIAGNQKLVDQIAATLGLPAGTPLDKVKAAAATKPQAAVTANAEQKAIDDMAKKQGFPAGLTKDQFYKMYQDKLNKQQAAPAPAPAAQPAAPVAEGKQKEADYGPDYQDMVARVKKLAGLGPLKTVWDEKKRVYKNVPVAVQPAQQPKKEQR